MSGEANNEQQLVKRAQEGSLTAFEELYRAHLGKMYGLCLRMVADPDRAQDLTQEAFVRAWRKLESFRGESAFGTWLHRLAVNVVLGDLRSRGRWEDRTDVLPVAQELDFSVPPGQPSVSIDLERAIASLPPRARAVFVLHDVEGYRHKEIARLIGVSEGTSKAHLHRARRLLREVLK